MLGFLIALALAGLWATRERALLLARPLRHDPGDRGVLLVMGADRPGSNFDRGMDFGVTQSAWGRIPGFSSLERRGEDPTLNPGIVFALTRLALLAFATFMVQ